MHTEKKQMNEDNQWEKDIKRLKVVKRHGKKEHLKQGHEQKQIHILW